MLALIFILGFFQAGSPAKGASSVPACSGNVPESVCKDTPPVTTEPLTSAEQLHRAELNAKVHLAERALMDYEDDLIRAHHGFVFDWHQSVISSLDQRMTDKVDHLYIGGKEWIVLTKQWQTRGSGVFVYGTPSEIHNLQPCLVDCNTAAPSYVVPVTH